MITGDDFLIFMELSEEWEKVFGEELKEDPMISSDQFPMLRECLRLKSKEPWKAYIKSELDKGRIY
ncbi:MAG: hypothetical protein F4X91_09015 [Nitrospinae bacterium]|nr:hypothetical protein [Nitrospinota bacterium]